MRARLLVTVALPFTLLAPAAWAVDVADDRTAPIDTATIDSGAPGDINITSPGSVILTDDAGPAVTLNSDNDVTNAGQIQINDVDNAVGILVEGGNSGRLYNTGQINLLEDYVRADADNDGDTDGPVAEGTGRVGILVEGPDPFDGDIIHQRSGSIVVEGNDSAGIRVADNASLTGDLLSFSTVRVTGANAVGVDVQGAVAGRVETSSSITVNGEDASAVVIMADAQAFQNNGSIQSSGFVTTSFSNYYDPDDVPDNFQPFELDADELLSGKPAVAIGANLEDGFYNGAAFGNAAADDVEDEDGNLTDDVKDIRADFNPNRSTGTITSFGDAPAVLISPDVNPDGTGDLTIGPAKEVIRDTLDDDDDDDVTEVLAEFQEEHGVVNRGTIFANGLNRGFDASALVITGSEDGSRDVVVAGGILNTGTLNARAREANSTTVRLGSGASADRFDNDGQIASESYTETDHVARGLVIEEGAALPTLVNKGGIRTQTRGDDGGGIAIQDLSGTLRNIENQGEISSVYIADFDDDDGDGEIDDTDERSGQMIALDLRAANGGIYLLQKEIVEDSALQPTIVGDILLGDSDDVILVLNGTIDAGQISFGDGTDLLSLNGEGVVVSGALVDSDGQLHLQIDEGRLVVENSAPVQIISGSVAEKGQLQFAVNAATGADGRINASNAFAFESGAELIPTVQTLLIDDTEFVLVSAEDLTIEDELDELVTTETAYLYNRTLEERTVGDEEQLVLILERKDAQELGLAANQASVYEPAIQALAAQTDINRAFASLNTEAEFFQAYNQLLPDFTGAPLYLITSTMDGAIGAVGNRMDVSRLTEGEGLGLWVQEFLYYVDRDSTLPSGAYNGHGFGAAAGFDRKWGPFDAVGVNVTLATNRTNRVGGFDRPLHGSSAGVGVYAGGHAGALTYDLSAGAAYDWFEAERRLIVGDLDRTASSEWNGQHFNASARVGYEADLGWLQLRPLVSLDYMKLQEDSYVETGGGGGFNMAIEDRSSDMMAATALMSLSHRFDRGRSWWAPAVRFGLRAENGNIGATQGTFVGFNSPFTLTPEDVPSTGFIVGMSILGGTGFSGVSLDYDADIRDGFLRHNARVVVRLVF